MLRCCTKKCYLSKIPHRFATDSMCRPWIPAVLSTSKSCSCGTPSTTSAKLDLASILAVWLRDFLRFHSQVLSISQQRYGCAGKLRFDYQSICSCILGEKLYICMGRHDMQTIPLPQFVISYNKLPVHMMAGHSCPQHSSTIPVATSTKVSARDRKAPHKCHCGEAFSPRLLYWAFSEDSARSAKFLAMKRKDGRRMYSQFSPIRSQEINEFASGVIKKRRQQLAESGAATAGESVDEHTDLLSR